MVALENAPGFAIPLTPTDISLRLSRGREKA
jgi:hypothetical protein